MRKVSKRIVKNISVVAILIFVMGLCSCKITNFNFENPLKIGSELIKSTDSVINKQNIIDAVKNQNETKKSDVELGDKVVGITGDVFTLSHYKLPKVGDTLYGFKVNAIYEYEARNAKLVIFEHEKSGAKLMLISNDDEDKSAAIGFNTLTYDDKGIPHVFEHACLGGSEKYPNANLFDEASNKTYNTYMNAFTMQNATIYPISSLSDPQLFELYKFYLDGVMQPNILKNEKNLEQEAYRYVLHNKNDDINLSGIVYSEMAGNEGNINSVSFRNSLKTMFNGSYMGAVTGGRTSDIPNMTHEDLISFHEKYYHPSNMLIVLYGDIDYEKYLKYSSEEYLNKYDKKVIEKEDPNYKKQQSFNTMNYDFPVSEDAEVDGKTVITYNVVCEGMTPYEAGLFELVLDALQNSDGPIKSRLLEKYPQVNFSVSNGLFYPKPFFMINFTNVNEDYANDLKIIVEESFAEVLKDGINDDVLETTLNYLEYSQEKSKDSHGFANSCQLEFLRIFSSNFDSVLGILEHDKAMKELEETYKNGTVKALMEKYISSNNYSSMCITSPKKGMLEEESNKLKESLVKMKEGMTDDELTNLINKSKEFDKWVEEEASHSLIAMLRKATLSELDEYRAKCYAYEENIEGINFIRSDVDDLKYNTYGLYFDMCSYTMEEAMKLNLLSSLLLELPSKNYQGQKLKAAFNRYMINYNLGITVNRYYNGGYKPYFLFSLTTLDKNLDKSFELLNELMRETIFDDTEIVKSVVSSYLNEFRNLSSSSPTAVAKEYVEVKTCDSALYGFELNGLKYINFLKKVSEMSDDEIKDLLKEMEQLYNSLYNARGLTCQIIGNFKTVKDIKEKVINMSYGFDHKKIINRIDIASISDIKKKTAIVANGTMQYNYMATPMFKDSVEYTGKYEVLDSIIDAEVLYPEFRVKRAAYGSYTSFSRLFSYVYTYRDPNLKESYEIFEKLPTLMRNVKITEEELNDYKLNAYAEYSYPLTKYGAAAIAVNEAFSKVSEKRADKYVRYMREIKNTTKDDIYELCEIFDKMVRDGIYVTVGSKEQIENNADLFDEIIYDYVQ